MSFSITPPAVTASRKPATVCRTGPVRYSSLERLVEVLDAEIVQPAEARFAELLARKAEALRIKNV